jgi:membrane protein
MRIHGAEVRLWDLIKNAFNDIMNNHIMSLAAGLSYYFVLSLFPFLILLASLLAYLPIPHLFDQILVMMARVVPSDSMRLVYKVVGTVVHPNGGLLTLGIIGTLWASSGGFNSLIEALNVAYNIPETRPIWKTRLLSVGLTFVIGGLLTVALATMVFGPKLGEWIADLVGLGSAFVRVWPYIKWGVSIAFTVLAVELLFWWAPNVRQRFRSTLPGAIIGVVFWIGSSYLLGFYFRHFANYNKTYGILGAAIALMVWLYWSWFAVLIGAEINAEVLKATGQGKLELKEKPPAAVKPRPAWEERPAA